jgi:hypothetical protein
MAKALARVAAGTLQSGKDFPATILVRVDNE